MGVILLNSKQKEGLELAVNRYRAGDKCTIISGYARWVQENQL